jgi:hypothetical protein
LNKSRSDERNHGLQTALQPYDRACETARDAMAELHREPEAYRSSTAFHDALFQILEEIVASEIPLLL